MNLTIVTCVIAMMCTIVSTFILRSNQKMKKQKPGFNSALNKVRQVKELLFGKKNVNDSMSNHSYMTHQVGRTHLLIAMLR